MTLRCDILSVAKGNMTEKRNAETRLAAISKGFIANILALTFLEGSEGEDE